MAHIPHTGAYAVTPDSRTPGARNAEDFVFFAYPDGFPEDSYAVVVPSLTNGWDRVHHYNIGPLRQRVALPQVALDPTGLILVIPLYEESLLPRFQAKMVRGKRYVIPQAKLQGTYSMA